MLDEKAIALLISSSDKVRIKKHSSTDGNHRFGSHTKSVKTGGFDLIVNEQLEIQYFPNTSPWPGCGYEMIVLVFSNKRRHEIKKHDGLPNKLFDNLYKLIAPFSL